jgi:hypothetical protein
MSALDALKANFQLYGVLVSAKHARQENTKNMKDRQVA